MATADVVRDMGQTLLVVLQSAGIVGVANADIHLATPDEFEVMASRSAPLPPTITVFLYRVTIAPEQRNAARRVLPDGSTTRPLLPLELHYLVTPWASATADEHRIIGRILQQLYDHAELSAADLQGASWGPGDSVQLSLNPLTSEEQLQLWQTMAAPYRLSVAYKARIIGVEPALRQTPTPVVEAAFGGTP